MTSVKLGLLPAGKACRAAITFAKEAGARITGYYAAQPAPKPVMGEGYLIPSGPYKPDAGGRYMKRLARRASATGVRFDAVVSKSGDPAGASPTRPGEAAAR